MEKKEETRTPISVYFFAFVTALGLSYISAMFLWETVADSFLFDLEKTVGITPTLSVLLISFLSIIGGIVIFFLTKMKNLKLSLFIFFYFISLGVSNIVFWLYNDSMIKCRNMSLEKQIEYLIYSNENKGYSYISEVRGYKKSNEDIEIKVLLFTKTIEGKRHYYGYIKDRDYRYSIEKYLIKQYDDILGLIKSNQGNYIVDYDFDWYNIYSQNAEEKKIEEHEKEKIFSQVEGSDEPQKIIVEHKRDLQIVQKWQNCGGCAGSGSCGTCNGSGRNPFKMDGYEECPQCHGMRKCQMCGGRGGYYYEVLE